MFLHFLQINIFWCLLIVLLSANAFPQERVLSLREAIEQALSGNPELRANEKALSAHREDIGIAKSFLLPKLTFEERFMRTNNPTYAFMAKLNQERFSKADLAGAPDTFNHPEPINNFQTSLSFEQAIFAPKAYIGYDMAKEEYSAKGEDFSRKREEVALNVFKTYLGIQTAKEFVAVTEKGIEDAKEHAQDRRGALQCRTRALFRYAEGAGSLVSRRGKKCLSQEEPRSRQKGARFDDGIDRGSGCAGRKTRP